MSRNPRAARAYLISGSVAYFLLWQFGTVIDPGLVPFHTTSVGVHLALVASMIGLAVLGGRPTEDDEPVSVVSEYTWDMPSEAGRPRPTRNRPPGRGDRHTAPRMAIDRPLPDDPGLPRLRPDVGSRRHAAGHAHR